MAKQSLGRGFDVLMPKDLDISILEEDNIRVQKLLTSDIIPNPDQPRREFDDVSLKDMASSIKRHGILQPIIVVRAEGSEGYKIVAGERRWRAAQLAKLQHVPAIVRSLKELEQIELALIENIQRVDLSPLEQALSVYKLQHHFNLSLEQISEKLGKAQSTVSNLARLLKLPKPAQAALREGKISEGHARAILSLSRYPSKQEELLSGVLNNTWTVRQAEQFAVAAKKGATSKAASTRTSDEAPITKLLSAKIGLKVRIRHTAKGGQLIIPFSSNEDLEKITRAFN